MKERAGWKMCRSDFGRDLVSVAPSASAVLDYGVTLGKMHRWVSYMPSVFAMQESFVPIKILADSASD